MRGTVCWIEGDLFAIEERPGYRGHGAERLKLKIKDVVEWINTNHVDLPMTPAHWVLFEKGN